MKILQKKKKMQIHLQQGFAVSMTRFTLFDLDCFYDSVITLNG